MRLNIQDKCCCRYNKATGKVGGRVTFPLHLDCGFLMEGRWKTKWIRVCGYETSVHFCQAFTYASFSPCIPCEYRSHPPPVTQQWVITSPPQRLIMLVSKWHSCVALAAAGIKCALWLPSQNGLILQGVVCPSRWEVPAGTLGDTFQLNYGPWGQLQKMRWLKPVACELQKLGWGHICATGWYLCSPSGEVFRIAQMKTGVPFSRDCSCKMILKDWRAS